MAAKVEAAALSRRSFLAALAGAPGFLPGLVSAEPLRSTFQFSVLSLFHAKTIILHNPTAAALPYALDDGPSRQIAPGTFLLITLVNDVLLVDGFSALHLQLPSCEFELEVPAKLRRAYRGTLSIKVAGGALRCIVGMQRELAVASIVAAESRPHAGMSALAAQAVAARSFMVGSHNAHVGFDFCDTTHCQFLREPPAQSSPAALATRRSSGLVLYAESGEGDAFILPAMYSRSCGGRTRTLAELGLPSVGYPYYSVVCAYCTQHPEVWQRDASGAAQSAHAGERERLDFNRIHGWSALPGNNVTLSSDHQLHGRGIGHGLGLCQLGAADMAARGASFDEILSHYYPNTRLA